MVATMDTGTLQRVGGGTFLIEALAAAHMFTLEDLTAEQMQIAEMTTDFAEREILTRVAEIESKQYDVSRKLMLSLGELGLLGVDTPEEYGGLELDKITSTLVAQNLSLAL